MRYGNYNLKVGDRDSTLTFGGSVRAAADGDLVPMEGEIGFVEQLQTDLAELGFKLVGTPDGIFGRNTLFALREFQIYCQMPHIAQQRTSSIRYSDSLTQVENPHRYGGPISGVANADTRLQLANWIDHSFRCPLVIECWSMDGDDRKKLYAGSGNIYAQASQNLWGHGEIPESTPRMFARDFSGYYKVPAAHTADELSALGDHWTLNATSGPRSVAPRHTWTESEILPSTLIGTPFASMSAKQRSTFKVVRAVSEVECVGFFDSLNAYDTAILSLGPCHWTFGITSADGSVAEGELCAFMSYVRHADPQAFESVFGFFGASIDEDWTNANGVANGDALWQPSLRKYTGWLSQQNDAGEFVRVNPAIDDANYFKHWHWFYRLSMAGRTNAGFRKCMYDFARVRIRDILTAKFGATAGLPAGTTLGDVYTSERAAALLLRWHVRYPARVIIRGNVTNVFNGSDIGVVETAFKNAGLSGEPTTWTDVDEEALVDGLVQEVERLGNIGFRDTIDYVNRWPDSWGSNYRHYQLPESIGRLSTERGSFQFDEQGLPIAP
ncbi:peptidoglycan-binding domain-containing protein [Planctomycetes bacterium K23_9]|uniref:Peptidoglycan binding-like domain-containing protein n=1 Tax=Stieleria marina TaxID=1930275 RepID=A0A517NLU9_9BACT|nr:hypothetical protein K239x_00300 [Planctomycetes bacterium K23_9]